MKALRFDRPGEPGEVLQVADAADGVPVRNQVRVRMRLSPVNPSDLLYIRGNYTKTAALPAVPGFEGMGVVEQSGGGLLCWLRGLKPGKRVAVIAAGGGAWQETLVVSARHAIPLPDDIPDEQAASFFVNPATALALTQHVLKPQGNDILLQTAAGSALGRMVIRLGRRDGFRVLNMVRRREQVEELLREGAWQVVCSQDEDVGERIRAIAAGASVRWAIDAVGGATGQAALRALAPGGQLVVYGTLSGEPIPAEPRELISGQKTVTGFWLGHWAQEQGVLSMLRLFRRIKNLLREGVLTSPAGGVYAMADYRAALAEAERPGRPGKVLLRLQ